MITRDTADTPHFLGNLKMEHNHHQQKMSMFVLRLTMFIGHVEISSQPKLVATFSRPEAPRGGRGTSEVKSFFRLVDVK
jgi:hypothetical protein